MVLNLHTCKDYLFTQGILISNESGNKYKFRIDENDTFYWDMKRHISNGKVEGLTKATIDKLFIIDPYAKFIKEKILTLRAIVLVSIPDKESGKINVLRIT